MAGGLAWTDAASFRAFAGRDPDLWREIEGAQVMPRDARRGEGTVLTVRWGSLEPRVPAGVLLRVAYNTGLTSMLMAERFDRVMASVLLPQALAEILSLRRRDGDGSGDREKRLADYADKARGRQQALRATRVGEMRAAARRRRERSTGA
jgi:hypothetical protein